MITLVVISIGALSRRFHLLAAEAVYPFENGISWVYRGVARRVAPFFRAQSILSEMRALEDEVERLRLDAAMLEGVAAENQELRRRLGLPVLNMYHYELCTPLSWGGSLGWWQSLRINKGKNSGIAVGDAVLCADGLVGRIKRVYADTSDVELLTDPNSRIACSLLLADDMPSVRGILQGAGWHSGADGVPSFLYVADPLRLEYMERDLPNGGVISPRTKVVTSGLSGTIPGGILVGWLIDSAVEPNGLYRTGKVLPAVDFSNIKTLFVLTGVGRLR